MATPGIPLWLKLAYSAWLLVWVPVYWRAYGLANFLWICDLANFLVGLALWLESRLLFSAQAVGVLLIQLLWIVDVGGRLVLGAHPIGGTEYMFDPSKPLALRLLSLFHVVVPVLLVWAIQRLGYDRRGWKLQTAILWALLPLTYWLTEPEANINWMTRPFGVEMASVPRPAIVLLGMIVVPLVVYLPTHAALARWRGDD